MYGFVLAATGAVSAAVLTGGLYALTAVPLTDTSTVTTGSGSAAQGCTSLVTVRAGSATFDSSRGGFVVRDLSVDVGSCTGTVTVVGTDEGGTVVTSGSAEVGETVPVDFLPGEVSEWHVVVQDEDAITDESASLIQTEEPSLESDVVDNPDVIDNTNAVQ